MKNWYEAQSYCSSELSLDGGGWRLPTVQELQSIIIDGAYNPSLDTSAFMNTPYSVQHYWSSTTDARYPNNYAWLVNYIDGSTNGNQKSLYYAVRCVR